MEFFLGQYFFILDAIAESNIIFRGLVVSRIQRLLLLCLHHSRFTRNVLQCNGKGSFFYSQRNIFLESSKEKRTVTALARRGETPLTRTAPSGWKTPCWQGPFANPPASSSWWSIAFIFMYLFQIQIFCLWFGLAGSSHSSHSCSETSWSLDLTGPFCHF